MKLSVLTVLFVATASWVGADALSLRAAVDRALAVNVDYQQALLTTAEAENSLVDPVNWKGLAMTATPKLTAGSTAVTGTLGVSLPLFDQLGVSASVDQDKTTQVSVTASPLVHTDSAAQAQITYSKALLAASLAKVTLETSVKKAYWAQAVAQAQFGIRVRKTALLEVAYGDAKTRLAQGTVTLSEVRTALKDWSDSRATQSTLERTLVKARAALAALLQTGTVELPALDYPVVEAEVKALGPLVSPGTEVPTSVRTQALEVASKHAKAEATWVLDPSLVVAGGAAVPSAGGTTWSGSATLTLALGDWQGADRALADRALTLARRTLEAAKTAAQSAQSEALLAVEAASASVEGAQVALTQAQDLLQQTLLMRQTGSATDLEVEESQVGVTAAQADLFSAWADLYGARLDLESARS